MYTGGTSRKTSQVSEQEVVSAKVVSVNDQLVSHEVACSFVVYGDTGWEVDNQRGSKLKTFTLTDYWYKIVVFDQDIETQCYGVAVNPKTRCDIFKMNS